MTSRRSIFTALFLLLCATSPAKAQNLYSSTGGKFSIDFLGAKPTVQSSDIDTDLGPVVMHSYMLERGETEVYMVTYIDYPEDQVSEDDADVLLIGAQEGALESIEIERIDLERELVMDGHPGIYFAGDNGKYYIMYELYLVGNRLYQVAILTDSHYPERERSDRFFGSFTLN